MILTLDSIEKSIIDSSFLVIEKDPATKPFAAATCGSEISSDYLIGAISTYHIQGITTNTKRIGNIVNVSVHNALTHEQLRISVIHISKI